MTGYHRPTMTDQLSLRLEPEQPVLPGLPDLRPMLPRPLAEPFDSDEHLFQPWWGGRRALVYVGPAELAGGGIVRVMDEDGADLTRHLRELAGLAVRVDARSAVLDGELVVVDASGRADAAAMAARLEGRAGRAVAFLALDLLHIDGRSLLGQPLAKRHCGECCARATRSSRCRPLRPRAVRCGMRSSPRAWRGCSPVSASVHICLAFEADCGGSSQHDPAP